MIPKLIAAIACALLLVVLGATGILKLKSGAKNNDYVKWRDKNSLKEKARQTKAEGKKAITLPGVWIDYPVSDVKLDTAFQNYSVVVAEVVTSKSYPVNNDGVTTWYKFRVLDQLSEKFANYCHTCPEPEVPEDLSSINVDEFLLPTAGGTINVDGVEVTVDRGSEPVFESGKKYLLILSLAVSRVASLPARSAGIFRVDENEKLEAFDKSSPIQAELNRRFGGDLSKLKTHIKR